MNFISPFNELIIALTALTHHSLDLFICLSLPAFLRWQFFRKWNPSWPAFQPPSFLNNTTALVLTTFHSLVMTILKLIWTKILSNFILFIQSSMKFFPLRFEFVCLFCMCVLGYAIAFFSVHKLHTQQVLMTAF